MSGKRDIVALHGNLGTIADWETLGLDRLRTVDLWEYSSLSLSTFAEVLATDLTKESEKPILAGYSLGGRLALQTIADFPERWSGAVILSAHPGLCCVEERIARRISDEIWAKNARELPWTDFVERWNGQPLFRTSFFSNDNELLELEGRRESVARAFENWSLGHQGDLRKRLHHFQVPVLWITGELDEKFTRIGEEMSAIFPDFRHEVISGCGHRVLRDRSAEVAGMLRGFSEEILS